MVKKRKKVSKRAAKAAAAEVAPQGRRFDDAQRKHALVLVAPGMSRVQVATTIGTTTESLRRWVKDATAQGAMPPVELPRFRGHFLKRGTHKRSDPWQDASDVSSQRSSRPMRLVS